MLVFLLSSCGGKKTEPVASDADSIVATVKDNALYGTCGDATSMNSIQLIADDGTEHTLIVDVDSGSVILGGLMSGDRLTALCSKIDGDVRADRVVNITTLMGQWTSLDRNFELCEDGSVNSNVSAESRPYTAWSFVNTNLILNTDTFSILSLGADSLELENDKGIFVYKRKR